MPRSIGRSKTVESPDQEMKRLLAERAKLSESLFSQATVKGYGYDWKMFCEWCEKRSRSSLPATEETVSLYLTDLLTQGKKINTAARRNCAIVHEHRKHQLPSPVTKAIVELLYCAQRHRGEKPRQMRALTVDQLRAISEKLRTFSPTSRQWRETSKLAAVRNRAMLVIGFASALRRSNIAALMMDDVDFVEKGLLLRINREKQDQEGRGRVIGLPFGQHPDTCPVLVLKDWLKLRGIQPGPVFPRVDPRHKGEPMDGDTILRTVKQCVELIGLDSSEYGGHSLRSGFVTAAAEANVSALQIGAHTGQSTVMVERYFRKNNPFRNIACKAVGF